MRFIIVVAGCMLVQPWHPPDRFLPVLKGTTIMVDGTRPQAPYTRITQEQYEASHYQAIEDGTDEDCATGACPVR